ncbi:MAG: FtsW/RodA/SpoVE family cell cycle protein, partial [Actinomycetota bacterium]|nr:FtsW/RodA/SpoVE family cell cycle protein [Actinomycetota bacterium]
MALRGRHVASRRVDNSSFLEEINLDKEKKKTFNFDFVLLICVILLSGFGLLVIYSATMFSLSADIADPAYYFKKQLTLLIISIFIFGAMLFINYRRFKRFWVIIFIANILFLISVLIFGYEVNETKGWIDLRFTSIQPSEFSKIFMIICVAAVLSKWRSEKKAVVSFKKVALSIFIAFLSIGLILLEPDFGQSIILFVVFILMLFVSGANFLYVLGVIGITVGGVFAG